MSPSSRAASGVASLPCPSPLAASRGRISWGHRLGPATSAFANSSSAAVSLGISKRSVAAGEEQGGAETFPDARPRECALACPSAASLGNPVDSCPHCFTKTKGRAGGRFGGAVGSAARAARPCGGLAASVLAVHPSSPAPRPLRRPGRPPALFRPPSGASVRTHPLSRSPNCSA